MKWIYDGLDPHNNQYDYHCSECNYSTWFAGYVDPNKTNTVCPKCGKAPNKYED